MGGYSRVLDIGGNRIISGDRLFTALGPLAERIVRLIG
jgi:hypothetical protein